MKGYLAIDPSSVSRLDGTLLIRAGTDDPPRRATAFLVGDPLRLGNGDYIEVDGTAATWLGDVAIAITNARRIPPPA